MSARSKHRTHFSKCSDVKMRFFFLIHEIATEIVRDAVRRGGSAGKSQQVCHPNRWLCLLWRSALPLGAACAVWPVNPVHPAVGVL